MMGVAGWFSGSTGKALFGAIVACFLQWCCSVISGAEIIYAMTVVCTLWYIFGFGVEI